MSNRPFIIGFDEAHKPRGKINSNYTELAELLNQNGFVCQSYEAYPITTQSLEEIDILVFVCPDFSKVSKNEIDAIKVWVKEQGGGLLLLSHAGGDKGRRSNLSELGQQFGLIFENDQCLDKYNNIGVENLPIINTFGFPHPINEGLEEICYRAGCTLSVAGTSTTPVVSSGPDSDPPETPVLLASENGEGRVIGIGSYEMFRDNTNGGLDYKSHTDLALNMFEWLKTTKREQMSVGASNSTSTQDSVQENAAQTTQSSTVQTNNGARSTIPLKTFETNVKIQGTDELFQAFEDQLAALFEFKERMEEEFEVLTKNTENLIRAVIATEDDILEFKQQQQAGPEVPVPEGGNEEGGAEQGGTQAVPESGNPLDSIMSNLNQIEEQSKREKEVAEADKQAAEQATAEQEPRKSQGTLMPPPGANPPPDANEGTQASNQARPPQTQEEEIQLTPLPSKPGSIQNTSAQSNQGYVASNEEYLEGSVDYSQNYEKQSYENQAGTQEQQEPEEPEEVDTSAQVLSKSKDELQQELDGLTKKLNSIKNLRSFVQKKFDSGKMNKIKYDKQIKKLENDKNKAKFRIEEIEAQLDKM